MRAGQKNRRIRIESLTTAKSGFGSDVETWTLLRDVWAAFSFVKSDEVNAASQLTSERLVTFKIDYIAALQPKLHRVLFQGQVYDIQAVDEVGYHEAQLLTCLLRGVSGNPATAFQG